MADAVPTMTGVRALVFDVDGTLYDARPVRRELSRRLLGAYAWHPVTGYRTARMLAAYRRAQEQLRSSRELGDVRALQLQLASWICAIDRDAVERAVERWMDDEAIKVIARHRHPEVEPSLRALRAQGVRLAALSDYPPQRTLEALGVAEHFDVVVCAQQPDVGVLKPHPRALTIALERLGVGPAEAVYVGDQPDLDAELAASVGVRCVIVDHRRTSERGAGFLPFEEIPRRLVPT